MDRHAELLLDVWREACRHIEIARSTHDITALLARQLPLERVVVRRLDVRRALFETVADGVVGEAPAFEPARNVCGPEDLRRLQLHWKAHRAARAIRAGTVWINSYNFYDSGAPFGGFKASGFGRDLGRDALDGYLETKTVWVSL